MTRVQYERTYVLLPPSADQEWAHAIISATWADKRYTLGGSADDAGIGDLDVKRVLAVNPSEWPGDLAAFYQTFYPGVDYTVVEAATPDELQVILSPKSGILLNQCDPRWANIKIAGRYCSSTLCQKGCWICDCAMAQRYYGIDPNATPETANALLGPDGFSGCDCKWSAMRRLGLRTLKTYSAAEAHAHLNTGAVVFAEVEPLSLQHFVMVTKYEGGRYWMYDPWKNVECWLDEKYTGVDSWRLISRTAPSPPPLPPVIKFPLRGVHDVAGADWLRGENLAGWCNISAEIGTHARNFNLQNYPSNIRFILNLRFSYATDDGGAGTMPAPDELDAFKDACLRTMRLNPRAWGFSLCNEMNNSREYPRGYVLMPQYYLDFYNSVYSQAPPDARILPGAIDPYNAGWGDWRMSWRYVLDRIKGAVGLTFHAYTHGPALEKILSTEEFSHRPLLGVYYDLRVLESQQAIVPERFRELPQIVTETNHWIKRSGEIGWEPDTGKWVKDAYAYFRSRGVIGACLFRFNYNDWRYGDKPEILEALKGAL